LGKPFETELAKLKDTYLWAMAARTDQLAVAIEEVLQLPLLTVGSGGSLTTANFVADLHREMSGMMATTMTPLEVVATGLELRATAVLFATAGGRNPDVLGSFRHVAMREPRRAIVLCTAEGSPLARLAGKFSSTRIIELEPPAGRDGFLATNSLFASVILLTRAYASVCSTNSVLPATIAELQGDIAQTAVRRWAPIWEKETFIVLHGPSTKAAAIDFESKCTEAALGNVQIADYRNFAHGRHHWLAKHAENTGVIAFITKSDELIASQTLSLLPKKVPIATEKIGFDGVTGSLTALLRVLYLTASLGKSRSIDPGRPGVPPFGRKIYHLRAFGKNKTPGRVSAEECIAIARKAGRSIEALSANGNLEQWRADYATFLRQMRRTPVKGLILDYDGTICGESNRYGEVAPEVAKELVRLLRAGVVLGIATGRGKSVRKALAEFVPKKYQRSVIVGYYNGGDIGLLDDESHPDGTEKVSDALLRVVEALTAHPVLAGAACLELRLPQVKVELKRHAESEYHWKLTRRTQ